MIEENSNSKISIATIGGYGFTENSFFSALVERKVDLFCDVRLRRGMRGSLYSFLNSERLQASLSSVGIKYIHLKELAPSQAIRDIQKKSDKREAVLKLNRQLLNNEFIEAYTIECLSNFNSSLFVEKLKQKHIKKIVFFCVEKEPLACHRSILARKIASDIGLVIEDIKP